jgi:hypothetical protein
MPHTAIYFLAEAENRRRAENAVSALSGLVSPIRKT